MSGFNPCMIPHTHGLQICKRGGDIMKRIVSRLIRLILNGLETKKQPHNTEIVISINLIIINKD